MFENTIWLVRHAESTANAGEPTVDYATIPLSERGRLQASQFAGRVSERPVRIVVSPFLRTRQTAQPLVARFPDVPVEVLPVHEFNYMAFPADQPTTAEQRVPLVEAYWSRLDPHLRAGRETETYAELAGRVHAFLREARHWRGFSVVFSHEQFIRGVALAVLADGMLPTEQSMRLFSTWRQGWRVPNTGVLQLHASGGGWWVRGTGAQPPG